MVEKRYLSNVELRMISEETNMLEGNINRMCVSDDSDELIKMFHYANLRLLKIYNICVNKYILDKGVDDGKN